MNRKRVMPVQFLISFSRFLPLAFVRTKAVEARLWLVSFFLSREERARKGAIVIPVRYFKKGYLFVFCFLFSLVFSFSSPAFFSSQVQAQCALPLYLQALQGGGHRQVSRTAQLTAKKRNIIKPELERIQKEIEEKQEVIDQALDAIAKRIGDYDEEDDARGYIADQIKEYIENDWKRADAKETYCGDDDYAYYPDSTSPNFRLAFLQRITEKSFYTLVPLAEATSAAPGGTPGGRTTASESCGPNANKIADNECLCLYGPNTRRKYNYSQARRICLTQTAAEDAAKKKAAEDAAKKKAAEDAAKKKAAEDAAKKKAAEDAAKKKAAEDAAKKKAAEDAAKKKAAEDAAKKKAAEDAAKKKAAEDAAKKKAAEDAAKKKAAEDAAKKKAAEDAAKKKAAEDAAKKKAAEDAAKKKAAEDAAKKKAAEDAAKKKAAEDAAKKKAEETRKREEALRKREAAVKEKEEAAAAIEEARKVEEEAAARRAAEEDEECTAWKQWGKCSGKHKKGDVLEKICFKPKTNSSHCSLTSSNTLNYSRKGKRECSQALSDLKKLIKEIKDLEKEQKTLLAEATDIDETLRAIRTGTEADHCTDCDLKRLEKLRNIIDPPPSGWETLGNVVGTVGAAALGYYGIKEANKLRDRQGFAAQPGYALGLAMPFIAKSLYGGGLFGSSSSLACSPTLHSGGGNVFGNPFLLQQLMQSQQQQYMQQMYLWQMFQSSGTIIPGFQGGGMIPGFQGGMIPGGMMGQMIPGFQGGNIVGGLMMTGMVPGFQGGMMGQMIPGFQGGNIVGGLMMTGMVPGFQGGMMGQMIPGFQGGMMGGMIPGGMMGQMMGNNIQAYFQYQQALMAWQQAQMSDRMQRQQAASGLYMQIAQLQMQIQNILYGGGTYTGGGTTTTTTTGGGGGGGTNTGGTNTGGTNTGGTNTGGTNTGGTNTGGGTTGRIRGL